MRVDTDLTTWLVGTPRRSGRRIAVVEDPSALVHLRAGGWADRDTRLFLRSAGYPAPAAVDGLPLLACYQGSFDRFGTTVTLDDGYVLQRIPYADAEFRSVELPTELRVWGADDYSAFLRDVDTATATGDFVGYLTNPLTVLADEAALGTSGPAALPPDRIYVSAGGAVSVSPTGPRLGHVEQDPANWASAASELEGRLPIGGTASLGAAVPDRDRADAVADRPGLDRYLRVVKVIRSARSRHRHISRVSGFGGRLTTGLPSMSQSDAVDLPVLVRVGAQLWIVPGLGNDAVLATPEQVGVLEAEISLEDPREKLMWAFRHLGITAARYRTVIAELPVTTGDFARESISDRLAGRRMGGS